MSVGTRIANACGAREERGGDRVMVPELSIVIPALQERQNLEVLLPALRDVLAELGLAADVIVVDGGSTDGTSVVATRCGAHVVQQRERGYGGALLAGFAATSTPWIVTMDADLSHRPSFLAALWSRRHEADILIASRYVPGGRANMSWFRRTLSVTLNRAYAQILALPIRDLSSGFRMYRRDVIAGMRLDARGFDVLEEILIRAHAAGCRITEVPFHYMARGCGRSKVRVVAFGIGFARTLLRMRRLQHATRPRDRGRHS